MNSTITQLDTAESALLTGYTLNVSHSPRKRAELYRAGDAKTVPLDYGQVAALLPRGPLFKEDPV